LVGLTVVAACGEEPLPPKDCTQDTGPSTLAHSPSGSSLTYSVKYEVTHSGEGSLRQITYYNGATSQVTVENPTLPWVQTLTLNSGSSAGIGMVGTVTNGRIEVKYTATAIASGTTLQKTANRVCEQVQD
jgi:hypothetical protein